MRPRLAFLTGQSDPGRCALSPAQRAVLARLSAEADGIALEPHNFPWPIAAPPWRAVPLLRASLANGRQYLAARRGALREIDADQRSFAQARLREAPRSLLLVGSCGLTLLDALIAPFAMHERARLRVVAYGAVAPRWPAGVDGVQLRGHRDRIADWLGPDNGPVPRRVDHDHLDYLDGDAVLLAVREQLDWLRGSG